MELDDDIYLHHVLNEKDNMEKREDYHLYFHHTIIDLVLSKILETIKNRNLHDDIHTNIEKNCNHI